MIGKTRGDSPRILRLFTSFLHIIVDGIGFVC